MFNGTKIKELEGDVKTLYKLYESLERKIKNDSVFESFKANQEEIRRATISIYSFPPELIWETVSVKTILELVLKKLKLRVGYKPSRKEIINEIPPEFKLVKREEVS